MRAQMSQNAHSISYVDYFAQFVTDENKMDDRVDWSKVLGDLSDCEPAQDGAPKERIATEPMKSNPCKDSSDRVEPPKKKRRDQARGDTRDLQPSNVTLAQFEEMCISMAYFGLQTDYSFYEWLSMLAPDDVLGTLGVSWCEVASTINAYYRVLRTFSERLKEAAQYCEPGWLGYNLKAAVDDFRLAHSIRVTDKLAKQGMQCAIDRKPCKSNQDLLLVEIAKHKEEPEKKLPDGGRVPRRRVDTGHTKSIVIGTRWEKLLIGIFWFYNLECLVAKDCRQWVEGVRSLEPDGRHALYPEFKSASNAELARHFIKRHSNALQEMHTKALEYISAIDKQRSMVEKKMVDWKKRHNSDQRQKFASGAVTVSGSGNATCMGGGSAVVW